LSGERVLITDDGERALGVAPSSFKSEAGMPGVSNKASQMAFVMSGARFDD